MYYDSDSYYQNQAEEQQYQHLYDGAVKLADKNGNTDIVKITCLETFKQVKQQLEMRGEFFHYMNNPIQSDDWRKGIRTDSGTSYFWVSPFISSPSKPAF